MDTLSRKHRLRQQKQQQVQRMNHQVLLETSCEGKENQVQKQRQLQQHLSSSPEDYDMSFINVVSHNNSNSNSNSNNNNNSSSEEEQFRVFKLVEIGQKQKLQQQVCNGKGVSRRQVSERIVHAQKTEQFNANKPFSGNQYCSVTATQEQQKKRHQQVIEVRECNYRNVSPSNYAKSDHQYRNNHDHGDDAEVFESNGRYVPTLKQVGDNKNQIQRQEQQYRQRGKEKQYFQMQAQQHNIYHQNGAGLMLSENGGEHSTSCSTTRSIAAYSSGFASEESSDRFHQSTGTNQLGCNSDVDDGDENGNEGENLDVGFAGRCANKLREHSRQRSRVIADLDRLMINAGRCSTSPAESYLSSCANSSTKAHMIGDSSMSNTNEFDYSTLCRDEFSSFIPVQSDTRPSPDGTHVSNANLKQQKQQPQTKGSTKQTRGGPVLVGIHHESSNNINNYAELSIDSSESNSSESYCDEQNALEFQEEIESSLSYITSSSKTNETDPSIDKEIVVINNHDAQYNYDQQSCLQMIRSIPGSGDDKLSEMLDIYLERVESLLKLTRGDKTLALNQVFGDQENEIQVSDQFKTPIEFSPIKQSQKAATKVIQEVKMVEMTIDEEENEDVFNDENLCNTERNVTSVDFKTMLLDSPQTSAKLNWDRDFSIERLKIETETETNDEDLLEQRRRLEASLLNRFLELDEFKNSCLTKSSGDTLVNSIRRHVSEFVEDFNTYQRELRAKTTFASDWHQNWLFAFKRPNELSSSGRVGGTKRAKMSEKEITSKLDQVTERSTNETITNHLELIEYSTLLLDKFKPVTLTYLTPQIDRYCTTDEIISTNESIRACYEAQEERLKELQCLALESSRQTDACRLLLCDFDDGDDDDYDVCYNGEGNHERLKGLRKSKNAIRKRRALLISYSTSLLIQKCSGNKFTFSSYGYLFQCNLPAAETSCLSYSMTKRIQEDILLKLKQKVELKDKRKFKFNGDKCTDTSERIKFLVGVGKNVALVNELPVIQFCIKVSGSLPIKVRWFRQDEGDDDDYDATDDRTIHSGQQEISSVYVPHKSKMQPARRRNIKVKEGSIDSNHWPIEMQADFDYEYQTEWSSWFRFKRCQDDILFEIRDANSEIDYGKRYKCVVENYCSREECNFSLTRREIHSVVESKIGGCNSYANSETTPVKKNNYALLRTWSQRTLHKPLPQTTMQPSEIARKQQQVKLYNNNNEDGFNRPVRGESNEVETGRATAGQDENDLLNKRCSTLKTVGRLSATVAAIEEDKFGSDFPYHPENLLKRLEQNKFSVPLKYKQLSGNGNNGPIVDKIDATESTNRMNEVERSTVLEASIFEYQMEVSNENLSPNNSPQIQSTEKDEILHFETHHRVLNRIQPPDKREEEEEERPEEQAYHLRDLSQRHLKLRELPNKRKDGKLLEDDQDDSTNELANSFGQVRFGIIYQQ